MENVPRGPASGDEPAGKDARCAQALWPCPRAGRPCAVRPRLTSRPAWHRHLSASHRGSGPERLVWRTRTWLARFADLRNRNSVFVHPSGEFVRNVAGLCARFLHLHRSVPVAHRVQCGAPARPSSAASATRNARPCANGGTRGGIRLVHRRSRERKSLVAGARGDIRPRAGNVRQNLRRLEEARPSRRLAGGKARDQARARIRRCRGRVPGDLQGRRRPLVAGERSHVLRRRRSTASAWWAS